MTTLYIAEKPSAAKAIAEGIGSAQRKDGYFQCSNDTLVSYAIGHLFELEEPDVYLPDDVPTTKSGRQIWRTEDLPIIPEEWRSKPKKETKSQLNIIGRLLKKSDSVVHAGDCDREGQSIVDDILQHFKYKGGVKRFIVSAQDPISITRGLSDLKDNTDYIGWREASQARQRADWLVGMNLSRAYTLSNQKRGDRTLIVVGRVQSPTLALVVKRDYLIKHFKPINYYIVESSIGDTSAPFKAKWIPDEDYNGMDEEGRLIDESVANSVADKLSSATKATVSLYSVTPKSTPQPLGLSLSDITLVGSNKYGMTADAVLSTAQALYEKHKLLTYPRSDCSFLPQSQFSDAPDILKAIASSHTQLSSAVAAADPTLKSRIWNDKKVTAHHAIVPTQKTASIDLLSDDERNIYDLVCRNYIAQFYPKHEYTSTTLELTAGDPEAYTLRTNGNTITEPGWKSIYQFSESKKEEPQVLPVLSVGDSISIHDANVLSKKTTPPKPYTEGTLIKTLEKIHLHVDDEAHRAALKNDDGIGTPATRSSIISELKRREYLAPKGKYLISTEIGQRLITLLPKSVVSPVLTAQYESQLRSIQEGSETLDNFLTSQIEYVKMQVENAEHAVASAPPPKLKKGEHACTCGAPLTRRKRKSGDGHWWSCNAYPSCNNTFSDLDGKPNTESKTTKSSGEATEYNCPTCESNLIKRKKAKTEGYWYSCSSFPTCKERFFEKGGKPDFTVSLTNK